MSIEIYITVLFCFILFTHLYNRILVKQLKSHHETLQSEIELLQALYFVKEIRDLGIDKKLAGSDGYEKEIHIILKSRKDFENVFYKSKKIRSYESITELFNRFKLNKKDSMSLHLKEKYENELL